MKNSGSHLMQPSAALKAAPFWRTAFETDKETYPALRHDIDCDIAIIGGGITGLSAALSLSQNHDVVVLEQGSVAEGSSGFSAGILSLATTVDLRVVEQQFGRENAALLYSRLSAAVNRTLGAINLREDALQTGVSIYAAAKASHLPILETERQTRKRYGLSTRFHEKSGLPSFLTSFHGALELEGERAVNPVKLVQAIAKRAADQGCRIFESTPVTHFENSNGLFVLNAGTQTVKSRHLIVATGVRGKAWSPVASINRQLVPVKGDLIVTEPCQEVAKLAQSGTIALWDTYQMLYTYLRYLPDGRILAGGADSPGISAACLLSDKEEGVRRLHAVIQSRHNFKLPPVEHAWRASFSLPADGLPLVKVRSFGEGNDGGNGGEIGGGNGGEIGGSNGSGKLIVASTDGLPSGMLLGEVIANLIEGRHDGLMDMLRHDRKPSLSARLLSLLPNVPALRNTALKMVFFGMRLKDILS